MNRKIGVVAVLVAGALLMVMFLVGGRGSGGMRSGTPGVDGSATQSIAAGGKSRAANMFGAPAFGSGSDNVRKPDLRAAYESLRDCVTYVRFGAILQREAHNPEFPLNNLRRMGELPAQEQARLNKFSSIVQTKRAECGGYDSEAGYAAASRMLYDLALSLGRQGDMEAANCFVEAPWAIPSGPSVEADKLGSIYAANAKQLAQYGLRRGNWRSALAAFYAAQAEHGITVGIGFSPQEKYSLARLLQMGSVDSETSSRYGYDAARLAAGLSAGEIATADKQASTMYESYYKGKSIPESALSQNCGI